MFVIRTKLNSWLINITRLLLNWIERRDNFRRGRLNYVGSIGVGKVSFRGPLSCRMGRFRILGKKIVAMRDYIATRNKDMGDYSQYTSPKRTLIQC